MAGTHQHDKGYKELYQNKTVFLDLLRNILNLDWAQGVEPDDLTLVDTAEPADYQTVHPALRKPENIGKHICG